MVIQVGHREAATVVFSLRRGDGRVLALAKRPQYL